MASTSKAASTNPEAQALADLQQVSADITAAITAEILALQNAINAQGVNNSPAIEQSVANLRSLVGSLNASLTPPVTAGPPVITSLAPANGSIAGGDKVTATGTGFTGATGVAVGGQPAASFSVQSDTTLVFTTPVSVAGPANVVVNTPLGASPASVFTFA